MEFVGSSFLIILAFSWVLLAIVFLFIRASDIHIGVAVICANIWITTLW